MHSVLKWSFGLQSHDFLKWKRRIVLMVLSLILSSCAGMQSGQYVKLAPDQNLEMLAKYYQIPLWALIKANGDGKIHPGQWVFIPQNKGVLGHKTIQNLAKETLVVKNSTQRVSIPKNYIWPVPSATTISSGFGLRWGRNHDGIDIAAPSGSRVVSSADGVVVYSGNGLGGYGNLIVVAHADGYFSVYAHNKVNLVKEDQRVDQGQTIALVGQTGRASGSHLHFEIRYDSTAINPLRVVDKPSSSKKKWASK